MTHWALDLFPQVEEFLDGLDGPELERVMRGIGLLEEAGPNLPAPYSKPIKGSRHKKMKELRITYGDRCYRILYAFDTRRHACLLVAANKTEYGFQEFYDDQIAVADKLLDEHEQALKLAQVPQQKRGKVKKQEAPRKRGGK